MKLATRIAAAALIAPIRLYQKTLSPLIGPVCRFYPSCSNYTIQAIGKYGPIKGSWKGLKRICRCHGANR